MDSRIKSPGQQLIEKPDNGSALSCLPVEILRQIFIHCLPDAYALSPNLAPILLSRICRRWRETSVNMPTLWRKVLVVVPAGDGDWKKSAVFYDLWLKRSQGLPLSIAIDCSPNCKDKLRNILQPYNTQISSIEFLSGDAIIAAELLFETTDLPAFREVRLHRPLGDRVNDETDAIRSLSRLPCTLRTLKVIKEISFDLFNYSVCDVWAHLTTIKMNLYEEHDVLQLLRLCPKLSSLKTRLSSIDGSIPLQPLTHMNLQSWSISCFTEIFHVLFNALTLPALRVLEAHYLVWCHKEFMAFLARSDCPLEHLILGFGVMMTERERRKAKREYIALLPSLEVEFDVVTAYHYG
ncbi:hypothetical protein AZE42_09979 [Rhizopogon vesiculosus]|uniref:Uncharacterized protein n=1 Tax=Rhizopogon vesiculosus TaxID=180088 RepID=A0A1J8QMB3_9AGAM|nr:hypothetical protein AZE42_09979 [Rhizopogon vesiculosus]